MSQTVLIAGLIAPIASTTLEIYKYYCRSDDANDTNDDDADDEPIDEDMDKWRHGQIIIIIKSLSL